MLDNVRRQGNHFKHYAMRAQLFSTSIYLFNKAVFSTFIALFICVTHKNRIFSFCYVYTFYCLAYTYIRLSSTYFHTSG